MPRFTYLTFGRTALWVMATLATASVVFAGAQVAASYRQPAAVLANGGGPSASTAFRETGSVVGHPAAGGLSSSSDYHQEGGFPLGVVQSSPQDAWVLR
jgi:hypothetical protein